VGAGTAALRDGTPVKDGHPSRGPDDELQGWGFEEGDQIVPGRHAVHLLGGGTRYEAYLAWDELLHTLVVVKVLRPDRVEDPGAKEGLRVERDALAMVDHPVIVRCFDAVLEGDRPHLVLEFLEGPRLSTLIRRYGPVGPEQWLPLATQVCSALHYMHNRGLVHLDIKPRNLIMGAPPRVIDLSVARTIEDAARLAHPVGTDLYMAPEQCDPKARGPVTPAVDVYGLGVTLYEAAAGRLPWREEEEEEERFPQLGRDPLPLPEEVPEPLVEPILACLEPMPEDRPTPAALGSMLEPLVNALPRRHVLGRLRPRLR
jgi:eukaryotic-like serine/threonine-protein kinase